MCLHYHKNIFLLLLSVTQKKICFDVYPLTIRLISMLQLDGVWRFPLQDSPRQEKDLAIAHSSLALSNSCTHRLILSQMWVVTVVIERSSPVKTFSYHSVECLRHQL